MTFASVWRRNLFPDVVRAAASVQKGDLIVIDNARSHCQTIEQIMAEAGCDLSIFPLFFHPNLNLIEHWWFVLKNWMWQRWTNLSAFMIVCAFKHCPNFFS